MIFIRSLVIVESKLIADSDKADYIAFDNPNAQDQKRVVAFALELSFRPVFCILMLEGSYASMQSQR